MAIRRGRNRASTFGCTELELTDTGRAQAKLAERALAEQKLVDPMMASNPRQCDLVTAKLAGLTVDKVSPLLAECTYGSYEDLTTAKTREAEPAWLAWTHRYPRGEKRLASQRTCRPGRRYGVRALGVTDHVVRQPWPPLLGGDHTLDRAAICRGPALRYAHQLDWDVRVRVRATATTHAWVAWLATTGRTRVNINNDDDKRRPVAQERAEQMRPSEPPFALCGPRGTLVADGVHTRYDDVYLAQAALRSGVTPILLGALPFDAESPAALMAPSAVLRTDTLPNWQTGPLPTLRITAAVPTRANYRVWISNAREQLTAPGNSLHKVVLARALQLVADAPLDGRAILRRLVTADPTAYGYLVDLTAAGGQYAGVALVGASPELLVSRFGDRVVCRPFAGSAPRATNPEVDSANSAALAGSIKNRHEHQLVIDAIRAALEPVCDNLTIAPEPELSRTAAVWHLCTPISGRLRDTSITAIDLALMLHPTPAVGGVPAEAASELIAALEGDRGFYAGAVGWCDARGDGHWVVSIRCAQLSADRRIAFAHAGGGIVAESDPDDEVDETTAKFATILNALGVKQ
ncbi:putative isochorismate synthase [Mycobacterium leprae]|uniref:isochorismate synthase n=4 Tax=Mycobacterium leprae TaxID=1769 RepID=Q9CCH5_MYCLE|nr:isochorismate synthase [Mycobacterium leprae]CAC30318.1 putative isochorismate synthase [Mycobacterium leprae]CAR70903.1 putative isochorismate synthase [Mycobacterium leprae Br4923]